MEPRIIKTPEEYQEAMKQLQELVSLDPYPGTTEAERLELLALLIENYEREKFPIEPPDAIEAIKFRMEQQGLSHRDLIPFIGSRSRVHEVISGKRPLTLRMIRALHEGLQIPAEALLKPTRFRFSEDLEIEWENFPIKEMIKRGWIEPSRSTAELPDSLIRRFLAPLTNSEVPLALFKRSVHERSGRKTDVYALYAWIWRIRILAKNVAPYSEGTVDEDLMKEVANLSWFEEGPRLAQEFLGRHGIALIFEPHLPGTYLDGAAIGGHKERPILGLTLRYDRLDNFWFTLMHELAHVCLHVDKEDSVAFIDDLDVDIADDLKEKEADQLAEEVLLPPSVVRYSRAVQQRSPEAIEDLANKLRRHPAIIAGKIRHDSRNYRLLTQYAGSGGVRCLFKDVAWEATKDA